MALEDDCIFWNKLGNNAEVDASEIGANGVRTGAVTYTPCKYDDGVDDPIGLNTVEFPAGSTSNQAGIGDFWWKPAYSDTDNVNNHDIIWIATPAGYAERIVLWWSSALLGIQAYTWEGSYGARYLFKPSFTAGDLIHVMYLWDSSAGGGDRLRMWFDGVELDQTTITDDGAWNFSATIDILLIKITGASNGPKCIIDNLKYYNSVSAETTAAVIANRNNEGWPAPPPPAPDIIPVTCVKSAPRVMVAGHDLVALGYVEEIQPIKEYKTFQRDKLIQNNYRLKVKNFDEFFSLDNPVSQFKDSTWQYLPIQVYNEDNDLDWDGIIEDIPRFHQGKTAAILSVNAFKKYAREKASYVSSTWETAGDVAKGLMDAAGFTNYDNKSIQDTIAQLTANSCYIKANFQKDSDTNLQQALEKTAEAGAADCYSIRGIVNFKHFTSYTGGVKVNLTTADLKKAPAIRSLTKEIVNDYRIYYSGSETPVTDADAGNIGSVSREKFFTKDLREMGGKSTDQIIFKDAVSCQYIGEQLIRRSHINLDKANVRAVQEAKFAISLDYRNWTDLNTYLRLDFTDEAWVNKLLEIFVFTKNFKTRLIEITAYEAQE